MRKRRGKSLDKTKGEAEGLILPSCSSVPLCLMLIQKLDGTDERDEKEGTTFNLPYGVCQHGPSVSKGIFSSIYGLDDGRLECRAGSFMQRSEREIP